MVPIIIIPNTQLSAYFMDINGTEYNNAIILCFLIKQWRSIKVDWSSNKLDSAGSDPAINCSYKNLMPLDLRFLGKIYEQIDFICFPLLGFHSYRLNLQNQIKKKIKLLIMNIEST